MAGRWLAAAPSRTLDKHMSDVEVVVTSSMHLGVDVMAGGELCRFCNAVMDSKGLHPASCMSGGDTNLRHNAVRNIIYRYAARGNLHAELEKAGVLDEPGVFVDLSRPADIMIDDAQATSRGTERVALDVKIINALGPSHLQETLGGSLVAAANYREHAFNHLDTRARCAAKGVRYEPLVFTTQGGCERHAEALISQIAAAVAQVEDIQAAQVKAEMLETICQSIMRSVAKAVIRR
eukprot:2943942-Karenia_brevis.AAC.1